MKIRNYLSSVLDGMAKGLFSSLIVGTIVYQIGALFGIAWLMAIGQMGKYMMGPAIGVGVASKREVKIFTLLSAIAVGALGAGTIKIAADPALTTIVTGEPLGAFCISLIAIEMGKWVEGKTKFDLLIVPTVMVLVAGLLGMIITPVISQSMIFLGNTINEMTLLQPLPMGILLSVIVGMILTLPVSSAALCISIGIHGIAAGAALAGCCAQMVGFAVISYRENKWSGLIAQGLGTSMVQVPNIIRNPLIWVPPTVASAITGPLSTMVFHMETDKVGAGMGTSGLVGPLATLGVMGSGAILPMMLLYLVLPAAISLVISEWMRKQGWIQFGDMKI